MEKVAERIVDWLPLGMGEARRNFVSGIISIAAGAWLLHIPGLRTYSAADLIEKITYLLKEHSIVMLFFAIMIIITGKIVDFVGSLLPAIYYKLSEAFLYKVSTFKIFRVSLYRRRKSTKNTGLHKKFQHARLATRKINGIEKCRSKRLKRKRFASELTEDAREEFQDLPFVVRDGLVTPFGWNFDISINFLVSQSNQKTSLWILHRENRRKFAYMIICSLVLPIFILGLLLTYSHTFVWIMSNQSSMANTIVDVVQNGLPRIPENQAEIKPPLPEKFHNFLVLLMISSLAICLFFFAYVKYVKACCVQYAEAFALCCHIERQGEEGPGDNSGSSVSLGPHTSRNRVRELVL